MKATLTRVSRQGFTLVEFLIVLSIMAVLAVIVIASINPTKNLADARNAQRQSDVIVIMNAVHQYLLDHGELPPNIPLIALREICKTGDQGLPCTNGVRLEALSGTYVTTLPVDPLAPESGTGTHYWMARDVKGRVTIIASWAEENESIYMTR